jgi:hypothetical protein
MKEIMDYHTRLDQIEAKAEGRAKATDGCQAFVRKFN